MKTLKDIIAEMRNYADRIETAHQREIEDAIAATVKAAAKSASEVYEPHIQSTQVGNVAKMREALEMCVAEYDSDEEALVAWNKAKAALSAPPRNCDVGTPEEQYDRFVYCCTKCLAMWSQLPYESAKPTKTNKGE